MATETDCWSCSDPPSEHQHPQDVSISEILDHGSISFGRFAVESLAWEKRSVFSHNRCQEELEKFRAPGLVAQKKAYFEEYYKKIRAMKALQVEQQETSQSDSCRDMQNDTLQLENGVDAAIAKDEIKIINVSQIHISDSGTATLLNSSEKGTLNKSEDTEEKQSYGVDNELRATVPDEIISLSTIESKLSIHEVSTSSIPPINRNSKAVHEDNVVFDTAKYSANGSKEHSVDLKAKGTIASGREKTKSVCSTMKTAVKPPEKKKTYSSKEVTRKTNNSLTSSKVNLKVPTNIKSNGVPSGRQRTEVCPDTNVLRTMVNNKRVLSSPTVRSGQVKTNSNSKDLNKSSTRLPVQARSVRITSRPSTVNSSSGNMSLDKKRSYNGVARKPLELNGHHMKLKGGEYENKRPTKVMSSKLPAEDKLNQITVVEVGRKSYIKTGKQNQGKSEIGAGLARDPKDASSSMSSVHKALTTKRVHKEYNAKLAMKARPQEWSWDLSCGGLYRRCTFMALYDAKKIRQMLRSRIRELRSWQDVFN